jgi:hypothetical protein
MIGIGSNAATLAGSCLRVEKYGGTGDGIVAGFTTTPPAGDHEMGEKIGQLRSTSEIAQLGIMFAAIAAWGGLWKLGLVGPILTLVGMFLTIIGLYSLALLMGAKLEVFEEGFAIADGGEPYPIGYDELKSITLKSTHHTMRCAYVGSRAEFTFEREKGRPWFRFACDYRRGDAKEKLFGELIRRCSAAIQTKLLDEMKEHGTVGWTDEVSMSSQGFLLQRPGAAAPLVVPFAEIEDVQIRDSELRICKRGDVLPFYTQKNDTRNFIPLYDLFCNFCNAARGVSGTSQCGNSNTAGSRADLVEGAV